MNSEWRPTKLGEVCDKIGSGATPRGGSSVYQDAGVCFIRSQNVLDLVFSPEGLVYVDDAAAYALRGVEVRAGDVLLNITGDSVARVCLVPADLGPARVSQHVAILRPASGQIDPYFLMYALAAPRAKSRLLSLSGAGATRKALTKAMISGFELAMPPLGDQERIAEILRTFDEKIASNQQLARLMEQTVATLFRSRFIDFDEVTDQEESEIGPIPVGWSVVDLSSLVENVRARSLENGDPYIGLDDMPRASTILKEWKTDDAPGGSSNAFSRGDILFGKLRPYFRKVGVAPIAGRCSTEVLVLRPLAPSWFGLALGHLSSPAFIAHCVAVSSGTRMPRAEWKVAGDYRIARPPEAEAAVFSDLCRLFYEHIVGLTHESRTLAEIRDELLPKLVSGQIRARDAEEAIEAA